MGWLQERLTDIFTRREATGDVEKRSQTEAARLQKQGEMRRLDETKRIKKRNKELWQQLSLFGAESLLKDVKHVAWRRGDVKTYALHCLELRHSPFTNSFFYGTAGGRALGIKGKFSADEEVDGWELRLEDRYHRHYGPDSSVTPRHHGSNGSIDIRHIGDDLLAVSFPWSYSRGPDITLGFLDIGVLELTEEMGFSAATPVKQGVETREAGKMTLPGSYSYGNYCEFHYDSDEGWVHKAYSIPKDLPAGKYFHLLSGQFSGYHRGKIDLIEKEAWVAIDDKQAKDKIKDFLLRDCEQRISEHISPRDIKL